jgi:hypothetical protein
MFDQGKKAYYGVSDDVLSHKADFQSPATCVLIYSCRMGAPLDLCSSRWRMPNCRGRSKHGDSWCLSKKRRLCSSDTTR